MEHEKDLQALQTIKELVGIAPEHQQKIITEYLDRLMLLADHGDLLLNTCRLLGNGGSLTLANSSGLWSSKLARQHVPDELGSGKSVTDAIHNMRSSMEQMLRLKLAALQR